MAADVIDSRLRSSTSLERTGSSKASESGQPASLHQIPSLATICHRALERQLGCSNVLELLQYFQMVDTPESPYFQARCMRFISDTYPLLRDRRGPELLSSVLGPQLVAYLEASHKESERVVASVKLAGKVVEKPVPVEEDAVKPVVSVGGHRRSYSYSSLVSDVQWPADVDPSRRELFLSPAEFKEVFGMSWDSFRKLPQWKRLELRKRHGLF